MSLTTTNNQVTTLDDTTIIYTPLFVNELKSQTFSDQELDKQFKKKIGCLVNYQLNFKHVSHASQTLIQLLVNATKNHLKRSLISFSNKDEFLQVMFNCHNVCMNLHLHGPLLQLNKAKVSCVIILNVQCFTKLQDPTLLLFLEFLIKKLTLL